jgi:hypothetical protein
MEVSEGLWTRVDVIEDSPYRGTRELSSKALHTVRTGPGEALGIREAFVVERAILWSVPMKDCRKSSYCMPACRDLQGSASLSCTLTSAQHPSWRTTPDVIERVYRHG